MSASVDSRQRLKVVLTMRQSKLMELTPDIGGLLIYLSDHNALDLSTIKRFMNDIAESGLVAVLAAGVVSGAEMQ